MSKQFKKATTIKLKHGDAAIVIRANLHHESYFPEQKETDALMPSSILAGMLMIAMSDKKAYTALQKRFDAIMSGKAKPIPLVAKPKKAKS